MIVYFADRQMNILGHASTELPGGLVVTEDLKTEDVETGVASFECAIPYDADTRAQVESCVQAGYYLLRSHRDEHEYYTIIETETDTARQVVYLYAEDAGLDLLNEICEAYAADQAYPIAHYIQKFAYDSGFEIGVNEASTLTRKLEWEGESTATERIASVATQFDNCEISYSFEIDGLAIVHKYINIYKQRGKDIGAQLRLNYEIDSIIVKTSIANVATALYPTGGTPEGEETPINLNGYSYDDGDIYLEGRYLKSREALKKWSRYCNPNEPNQNYTGHILKTYSIETTSQKTLCDYAVNKLKQISEAEVNYEIVISDLPGNIRLGDRVNIIDNAGDLYVSARILKLETSVANQTVTATLGEYLLQDAGIAQHVRELADQFSSLAQQTITASAAGSNAQEAVDTLEIRVIDAETRIQENGDQVSLMATKEGVNETLEGYYTKEETDNELALTSDEITTNCNTAITNVDEDLQTKFQEVYKYITFSGDGITISSGDSAITLSIDNETGIVFQKNGVQFGLWDGTDFYTGNIVVEVNERAQFGKFAFVPRSDGSLSFLKVTTD